MAKESASIPIPSNLPGLVAPPPKLEDFAAERERRQKERDAKRPKLMDCLDPTVAKYWEDRKDLYEWEVEMQAFRRAVGKQAAHLKTIKEQVVAHNEDDAWAMFCDKVFSTGNSPSRRDSKAKFKRLRRRTLRHNEDGDESDGE